MSFEIEDSFTPITTNLFTELKDTLNGIEHQQETIMKMILNVDGTLIRYINNPSDELIQTAVKQNGMAIQYILPAKQTEEIKMDAIDNNPFCFEYVYEPTVPMWLKAINAEMPEDEELVKKHPVKVLKRIEMMTYQKTLLYTTFLDMYPQNIRFISDDIRGYHDEDEIYKFLFERHGDIVDASFCPKDIIDKIIDDVMEKNPRFLLECDKEYWTLARVAQLFEKGGVCYVDKACVKLHGVVEPVRLYKLALDLSKSVADIRYVIYIAMRNINYDIDNMGVLLDNINGLKTIEPMFNICGNTYELVKLILSKFEFDDICKNVGEGVVLRMLSYLPLWKRIKYRRMLNKYLKEKDDGNK